MLFSLFTTALLFPSTSALVTPSSTVSTRTNNGCGFDLDQYFTFCARLTEDLNVRQGGSIFGSSGITSVSIKSNICVCVQANSYVNVGLGGSYAGAGVQVYTSDQQSFTGQSAANIANSLAIVGIGNIFGSLFGGFDLSASTGFCAIGGFTGITPLTNGHLAFRDGAIPSTATCCAQTCNTGYTLSPSGKCQQCPSGSTYDATSKSCSCPAGQTYSSSSNTCNCPNNLVYSTTSKSCVCPADNILCGGSCYPTATYTCPSGLPIKKKTSKREVDAWCPSGQTRCGMASRGMEGAWECVDIQSDLESCGGCMYAFSPSANTTTGQDCTALPNTGVVACNMGQCEIQTCQRGYALSEDGTTCVKKVTNGDRLGKVMHHALKIQSNL